MRVRPSAMREMGRLSCSWVMHGVIAALQVTLEDFAAAQRGVRPSAMGEVALELPRVRWGDVGGLDAIKQRLREAVEWPQKHPELLKRLGAKVGRDLSLRECHRDRVIP